ncbi:DUF6415 family natural product biosynthesis protein [Streptomyces scabiei]|uniref:DUF6415 family natural product biosynthesis protein n=1 Tax=Streptomyces scabiei TaxID=1930 RepID=UPI0029B01DFC|nr:DUF6415 family natural product biosynthesis protein [Streptomyces scabiei]MDX3162460.1 DUF6415 family natural product biosynthesis protein [Streptomyces scabiei]
MTARVLPEDETDTRPLDLTTMREAAARLLTEGAEPPGDEELEMLRRQLRGHVGLLMPIVQRQARRLPEQDTARRRALACVAMSCLELRVGRGDNRLLRIAVATRLARSVRTLCGHVELLDGARS